MEINRITEINDEVVDAFQRLIPQLSSTSEIPSKEQLEEMVSVNSCVLLAAFEHIEEEIIGLLTLVVFRVPTGVQAWIEDVVVDESVRGKGAGKALTRAALELAHEMGAKYVSLTSRPAREAANQLYLRLGFTRPDTNYYRYTF